MLIHLRGFEAGECGVPGCDCQYGKGDSYGFFKKGNHKLHFNTEVKFWLPLNDSRLIVESVYDDYTDSFKIIQYTNKNGVLVKIEVYHEGISDGKEFAFIFGKKVSKEKGTRFYEELSGRREYPTAGEGWKLL